ncbi:LAMI_0E01728g1_1 [Lachancea mirantina]|uniref:LAMI_0E01728g1_1 n=1 Tax=Lachancea mirantina TaxID=1230905 RepID=A0A1G4JIY0_9SACH|nr:LAMI_0E01728g1_1 [Lachancea mirantina]
MTSIDKGRCDSTVDHSLKFITDHHFNDTFALLVVFLSFNHFVAPCVLAVFVLTTRCRDFLATCFIRLFLAKRPFEELRQQRFGSLSRAAVTKKGQITPSATAGRFAVFSTVSLLALEIGIAALLKLRGNQYFTRPLENLAMSIVASSLINDPKDCLSYATSCSILYGLISSFSQKFADFSNFQLTLDSLLGSGFLYGQLDLTRSHLWFSKVAVEFTRWAPYFRKYFGVLRYFVSFHIVVFQFYRNMTTPFPSTRPSEENTFQPAPPGVSPFPNSVASTPGPTASAMINSSSGVQISTTNSGSSSLTSNLPTIIQKPQFSKYVTEHNLSELPITSPSQSNSQTISTNLTMSNNGEMKTHANYTNQFFEAEVNLPDEYDEPNPDYFYISTWNLENFILQLFKFNNHHLIPPLWSIFATIKTMSFERKQVKHRKGLETKPREPNAQLNHLVASGDALNSSVFNGSRSTDCMALIAPFADDYNDLHLIPINQKENSYQVCVNTIGSTQITFHIRNLFEGELLVLVNGVIWTQVSSAIVSEKSGEEYTVVSGLVPSCSYDIQFVNRFARGEDFLIADLMVRTSPKKGEVKEPLDFSFPSYYHRKFLSPLLTLKHSVLTTNTNLAEKRAKLKKTKKEISKKLSSLRQEIDHLKAKISQNANQDEKSAFKMDNLKTVLQQSEANLCKLEDELKALTSQQLCLEKEYLKCKDKHLRKQMEYGKLRATLEQESKSYDEQLYKLQLELNQLTSKKEKTGAKREKLKKEVAQQEEGLDNLKESFLTKREEERKARQEQRAIELNDYELKVKGLEQDISRIEGENDAMRSVLPAF